MTAGLAVFIVMVLAIITLGSVAMTWIKYRSGVPHTGADQLDATRQVELLSTENAGLKGQVSRLEERIAVLERIATDPAERTAREIEQLR